VWAYVYYISFQYTRNFALSQGKFIRIHFGPSGKLAGADIETCKSGSEFYHKILNKCMFGPTQPPV